MIQILIIIIIIAFFFGKDDTAIGALSILIRIAIVSAAFGLNPILGLVVLWLLFHGDDS
ncbi:MAG: hypothetical protein HFI06_11840 [Eubacterium sp.]|jgi:hypothetical protein|nr:hypothetical protein [Eubacterium sp.]